jgi:hypothetical protein
MAKVISFRVPDDVYYSLKKKNVGFRRLFEDFAKRLAATDASDALYAPVYKSDDADLCQNVGG